MLGEDVKITKETIDKRNEGYKEVRNQISPKINGASLILVLIGQDTHNNDWIKAEIELANSYHKQLIVTRVPATTGSTPQILRKKQIIPFHPFSIRKIIENPE